MTRELIVLPLTDERWEDLEALFGPSGAYSNCWCAFQRVRGREFSAGCTDRGAGNRALLRSLVTEGRRPGLLAYRDRRPVGWVSAGPRPEFGRILRSPITRLDATAAADQSVWSIACFFIPTEHRGQGVASALLNAAVARARDASAVAIEGYPVDTRGERRQSSSLFTGTLDLFLRLSFAKVAERRPGRPVVRRELSYEGNMPLPDDVDEYLAAVPPGPRAALQHLRETVRAVAPQASETISYQMPAFRDGDRLLVSYAAFKDHCSLFPMSGAVIEALGDELKPYASGKGTLRFDSAAPMPDDLVVRIVKVRLEENAARRRRR